MFSFLTPKNKVQLHVIREVPIETFEIIGISQINPFCKSQYDNEIFLTLVNFLHCSREYDEKETLVKTSHFALRRCPKCRKIELIPTRIRLNFDAKYLQNEEEVAYDAYSEYPSRTNTPSIVEAYCTSCSSCYEIRIKTKDLWVKQAKKIKDRDLITPWEEYQIDEY